jgi:hypothetical protein
MITPGARTSGNLLQAPKPHRDARLSTMENKGKTFNNNKLEYTDFSKPIRVRLEDSFLPGALQNPTSLHSAETQNPTRIREMTPLPNFITVTSHSFVD